VVGLKMLSTDLIIVERLSEGYSQS